jgi:hypothetical protein
MLADDDDDDLPAFFAQRRVTTTTTTTVVRRPDPPPVKRAAAVRAVAIIAMPPSLRFENDAITPETVEKLSTFDKGSKSSASAGQRLSVLDSRVKRSKEKVNSTPPAVIATATVDDSLLVDAIGSTARDYERHTYYKGSTRIIDGKGTKREKEEVLDDDAEPMDEDDDDDDDDDGDDDEFYMENDDLDDSEIHRTMLVPLQMAVPETGNARMVTTFSELVGPSPATKQFESNMRHVKVFEHASRLSSSDSFSRDPSSTCLSRCVRRRCCIRT